jgi:hypothetical protein
MKSSQGLSFLIACIIYICHVMWHIVATDVYYFDRDLESGKLRFGYNDTHNICNNENKIACLYPKTYLPSTSFLSPVYQVLEYRDYLNNREWILNKTNNSNFTVIDSRNQIWYFVQDGEPKPLVQAPIELENMQLSILYYTDAFFYVPNAHLYAMIATISAVIITVLAMFSTLVGMFIHACYYTNFNSVYFPNGNWWYLCNNRYLPWVLWMFFSTVFLGTILIKLAVIKSKMDGSIITLISIMADWSSTGSIIWIIAFILTKKHKADNELSEAEINGIRTSLNTLFLFLSLIPLSIPPIIYVFHTNIFGLDDASLLIGHSYVNMLMGSLDGIKFM